MATITINIDDSLLQKFSSKNNLEAIDLNKHLESMLSNLLALSVHKKKTGDDAVSIVKSFHLKKRREIPAEEMGKGAVALEKYV